MIKQKTLEQCNICKQSYPHNRLVFSCCNGWVCLECYRNQFPSIPMSSKPFYTPERI